MSSAFAKIAGATSTGGGNFVRDGLYKLMVEKIQIQSGHTGESFIAEFRVIESTPNGAVNEQGHPIVPNAVGSSCTVVQNLTKFENAAGNAKALVLGALGGLGYTEAQVTPEVMAYVCSENNPLRGLYVIDETYRGVNKGRSNPANAGKPLTLNKWKSVAQTEEDVKKQRTWLDANGSKSEPAATFAQAAQPAATPTQVATLTTPAAKPAGGLLGGLLGPK